MGYFKHHAIIVTSYNEESARKAQKKARSIFVSMVTPVKKSPVNSWWSFSILPDCSKEGWSISALYDDKRDHFIEWLKTNRYEDGSSPYDAVEVWFDEEHKTKSRIIN